MHATALPILLEQEFGPSIQAPSKRFFWTYESGSKLIISTVDIKHNEENYRRQNADELV
jgi:hypothetical protein